MFVHEHTRVCMRSVRAATSVLGASGLQTCISCQGGADLPFYSLQILKALAASLQQLNQYFNDKLKRKRVQYLETKGC